MPKRTRIIGITARNASAIAADLPELTIGCINACVWVVLLAAPIGTTDGAIITIIGALAGVDADPTTTEAVGNAIQVGIALGRFTAHAITAAKLPPGTLVI